jgi:serine/threonine protein kinase
MEDLTGKQLGHYQIVAPLGEGGMAAVYKAYQPTMDRYVALKVLPRHFASDPQFIARFQQEAKVLAKLQHPHILPVFDFGEADGYTYIVMPFVQSGTLADVMQGRSLPLPQIYTLISQIGSALDYAHAHGLIHRDVKPRNVLIDERDNCLLSDFGLVKMAEGSVKLTQTGGVLGTPAYMSPEQGRGQELDGRSDIYSLGVILYEMLTGRPPYEADTPIAIMLKHISEPLPLPRALNPALPEAVEQVVVKALEKNPADRYQKADELATALKAAYQVVPNPETPVPSPAPESPQGDATHPALPQHPPHAPTSPALPESANITGRRLPVVTQGVLIISAGIVVILFAMGWLALARKPEATAIVPITTLPSPAVTVILENIATTIPPSQAPTLLPTNTPPSVPTSQPIIVTSPTAKPRTPPTPCTYQGTFVSAWQQVASQLGCPSGSEYSVFMAIEEFERGLMIWKIDTRTIYVIPAGGYWRSFRDLYQNGDPDYSCLNLAPSQTPPTPKHGFGRVWCDSEWARTSLGNALVDERGFTDVVQGFEQGFIFRNDQGIVYVLYSNGRWEMR